MNLRNFIARLLGVTVAFALGCYLLKLGVTFLADIWIGLAIIAVTAACGIIVYRIYKYWKNTL